jgi:hypothetical protein
MIYCLLQVPISGTVCLRDTSIYLNVPSFIQGEDLLRRSSNQA